MALRIVGLHGLAASLAGVALVMQGCDIERIARESDGDCAGFDIPNGRMHSVAWKSVVTGECREGFKWAAEKLECNWVNRKCLKGTNNTECVEEYQFGDLGKGFVSWPSCIDPEQVSTFPEGAKLRKGGSDLATGSENEGADARDNESHADTSIGETSGSDSPELVAPENEQITRGLGPIPEETPCVANSHSLPHYYSPQDFRHSCRKIDADDTGDAEKEEGDAEEEKGLGETAAEAAADKEEDETAIDDAIEEFQQTHRLRGLDALTPSRGALACTAAFAAVSIAGAAMSTRRLRALYA